MINLGDLIDQELRKVADRVYDEKLPSEVSLPAVVYRFTGSNRADKREDFILQINIWGEGQSTLEIEQIADNITRHFDEKHFTVTAEGLRVGTFLISRGSVPDPDRNIRRREVRILCKTYFDYAGELPKVQVE